MARASEVVGIEMVDHLVVGAGGGVGECRGAGRVVTDLAEGVKHYRLRECFEENPDLQRVACLTLAQSLGCRLRLWDEERRRMVGFAEAREVA